MGCSTFSGTMGLAESLCPCLIRERDRRQTAFGLAHQPVAESCWSAAGQPAARRPCSGWTRNGVQEPSDRMRRYVREQLNAGWLMARAAAGRPTVRWGSHREAAGLQPAWQGQSLAEPRAGRPRCAPAPPAACAALAMAPCRPQRMCAAPRNSCLRLLTRRPDRSIITFRLTESHRITPKGS
mgnify:CR=1 FL=1